MKHNVGARRKVCHPVPPIDVFRRNFNFEFASPENFSNRVNPIFKEYFDL